MTSVCWACCLLFSCWLLKRWMFQRNQDSWSHLSDKWHSIINGVIPARGLPCGLPGLLSVLQIFISPKMVDYVKVTNFRKETTNSFLVLLPLLNTASPGMYNIKSKLVHTFTLIVNSKFMVVYPLKPGRTHQLFAHSIIVPGWKISDTIMVKTLKFKLFYYKIVIYKL